MLCWVWGNTRMKLTVTKTCATCKNEFRTRDDRRKTCCTECARDYVDQKKGLTVKEWKTGAWMRVKSRGEK